MTGRGDRGHFSGMRRSLLCLAVLVLGTGCSIPRWPVDGSLTSPFGVRRDGIGFRVHRGVDISIPIGTPVRAMAPGRVVFAGTMRGYGQVVVIDHSRGVRTVYAHLSEILVGRGEEIGHRAVIALSGSSGRSSGPHLHFEIQRHGGAEDPVPLLGGEPRPRDS